MNQYNFPTTILSGQGALKEFTSRLKEKNHVKALIVSDKTLARLGMVDRVTELLSTINLPSARFTETRPNPTDDDVDRGLALYHDQSCDCIIAIGGGSPIDTAKVIKILATNPPPLAQYDDCKGGDRLITKSMPPLYAIPTTAGTGSEVGRSGVIILQETKRKTIFFHPDLVPTFAVLEPDLTRDLPPGITAATGIDAFVHCLEAYLVPSFHPMADGIALQGMELILEALPRAFKNGKDLDAREKMQIAAAMGATAFQKGLGMIHSLAHPLSGLFDIHHGLANALMLPASLAFMEQSQLDDSGQSRMNRVHGIFREFSIDKPTLSESTRTFCTELGIDFGLSGQGISESDLNLLSTEAFEDPCHSGSLVPVSKKDLLDLYRKSL